jgi:hypothetical protein
LKAQVISALGDAQEIRGSAASVSGTFPRRLKMEVGSSAQNEEKEVAMKPCLTFPGSGVSDSRAIQQLSPNLWSPVAVSIDFPEN